ncbi:MAG TPA: hypothetical protein VGV91_04170 [Rubrobacter sp.]|nr:hypothetical protein [Rubrobacter sp.]
MPGSGVASVRLKNEGSAVWSAWQPYATSRSWTLSRGAGTKTVSAQFKDGAGNVSAVSKDSINYRP